MHLVMSQKMLAVCERAFVTRDRKWWAGVGGFEYMYSGCWLYSRMFLRSFGSVFHFICLPLIEYSRLYIIHNMG